MSSTVDQILAGKYPAKAHAKRVADKLRSKGHDDAGIIYIEGQHTRMIEDDDGEQPFRQRRNFFYLSGCNLPDSCLTYDIKKEELTLYVPPIEPDSVMWSGLPLSPNDALKLYDVDVALTTADVNARLAHYCKGENTAKTVYAIKDQVSAETTFLPFQESNFEALKEAAEECRIVKDDYEIALLRRSNDISSKAHAAVLKGTKAATNERELEAIFYATCMSHGSKAQSYHPIFASGTNGAVLHYQKNDEDFVDKETGEKRLNLLLDAGGEYQNYTSDITRVFPLSGKFTTESRQIYEIVLDMQMQSLSKIKAGVKWDDVHAHAHRVAIDGLLKLGILRGEADEIFNKGISVAFFPHGLGHYMGMDTHDVGGKPNRADKNPMFRYLRLRATLSAREVVTVEPGVYFCRFIIQPFLDSPESSKYIDQSVLARYWSVGGVRIEDDVIVTEDGYDNLTTAPKTVEDIERLVQAGPA